MIISSVKGTEAVVMSNSKAVIVVFRGSESGHYKPAIKDWMTNVKMIISRNRRNYGGNGRRCCCA